MASDEEMKAKAVAEEKAAIFKELLKREPKASEEEIGKAKKELSEALNELGMVQEREKKDAAAVDLRVGVGGGGSDSGVIVVVVVVVVVVVIVVVVIVVCFLFLSIVISFVY